MSMYLLKALSHAATCFLPTKSPTTSHLLQGLKHLLASLRFFLAKFGFFDFQIVKVDESRKNLVVSRKAILQESLNEKREEIMSQIKVDGKISGIVKNITDFGAFVDLGGIDGLIHITDFSWGRINHPSEVVSIGDKVEVKVIEYNIYH